MMFVLPVTHMRGGELDRHIESRDRKRREQQLREGNKDVFNGYCLSELAD